MGADSGGRNLVSVSQLSIDTLCGALDMDDDKAPEFVLGAAYQYIVAASQTPSEMPRDWRAQCEVAERERDKAQRDEKVSSDSLARLERDTDSLREMIARGAFAHPQGLFLPSLRELVERLLRERASTALVLVEGRLFDHYEVDGLAKACVEQRNAARAELADAKHIVDRMRAERLQLAKALNVEPIQNRMLETIAKLAMERDQALEATRQTACPVCGDAAGKTEGGVSYCGRVTRDLEGQNDIECEGRWIVDETAAIDGLEERQRNIDHCAAMIKRRELERDEALNDRRELMNALQALDDLGRAAGMSGTEIVTRSGGLPGLPGGSARLLEAMLVFAKLRTKDETDIPF